jgi:hypothetical protein
VADYNLLFQGANPGSAFANAFNQAQDNKRQNALMQQQMQEHQQDREFKMSQMQAEQRAQQLQAAREQLQITARLLDHATDPVSYQQARQAAAGIPGFDLSQVPEQYDPNWVAQTKMQVQALSGTVEQELMAVAPGTTVIDKRTGQQVFTNPDRPRYYALPPGGRLELDPSYNGPGAPTQGPPPPPPGFVIDGDAGGNASGGFPY